MYYTSNSFCEFEPYKLNWCPTYPISILLCVSFLLFDRKHLEKVLKKSWSTITLGWFVFALLLASRLLLLGKQTMGWGGGQNSLSGLHVHASTNQFFLPGTNAKRLDTDFCLVFLYLGPKCFEHVQKQLFTTEFHILKHVQNNLDSSKIVYIRTRH